MSIFFSPRLLLVASMGNSRMSIASINVAQNLRLQANNMPFEPSSRLCPSQTHIKITWCVTFKQQVVSDIWKCIYKCNILFHVVDTPTWKAMANLIAKIKVDDFHGPIERLNKLIFFMMKYKTLSLIWNLLNNHGENMEASLF